MVFWFAVRTFKYHFVSVQATPDLTRFLWYLFYLPMLFIPLLAVFVAMSLGRAEHSRLPRWTVLLYVPTAALFLLVLTNDLHQWVFPYRVADAVYADRYHGYAAGYYLVVGWMIACALAMLALMWKNCRIPYSRKRIWMPLLPISAMQEKPTVQSDRLAALARELQDATDPDAARLLLWKMTVIGAYLKRRSNLLFLAGQDGMIHAGELGLCMEESMSNLRLRVKNCAFWLDLTGKLPLDTAVMLCDFYEAAVEAALDTLGGLSASFSQEDSGVAVRLMVQCAQDLAALTERFPRAAVCCEDGVWHLALSVPEKGGAQ